MERLSLVQQIAQLEDVAPADVDPEDVHVTGTDADTDLDVAVDEIAARAHYFDVGPSSLRKLHESLSDPKYDGIKTPRKLMLDDSDDDENDSSSESHDTQVHMERDETGVQRDLDAPVITDASIGRPGASQDHHDFSSLGKIREDDRKKGKAISRQIALWDSLLDARIRLQKSVTAGNRLPASSQCIADRQLHAPLMKMLQEAQLLSNEIFDFQERLLSFNESIQLPPRKRRRSDEAGHSLAGRSEELRQGGHAASELEYAYHSHLTQTLNKWSTKIQAVTPSVLLPSNRNAFSRKSQVIKSAPQLIDETLGDHSKVLSRTRIYRGKESRLGSSLTEDAEVFDDTDFYHQLLRDIIDTRGNGTDGNDNWMTVQKEKKSKKKVDTKASKGRKLRYQVHEKIQNFMVSVPTQGNWHEEQIDELFASLLGKGFEGAMAVEVGFRVLG